MDQQSEFLRLTHDQHHHHNHLCTRSICAGARVLAGGVGVNEENILRALRAQAWERAKGELRAVLNTFFGENSARPGQFDELDGHIEEFVRIIEDEGLAE